MSNPLRVRNGILSVLGLMTLICVHKSIMDGIRGIKLFLPLVVLILIVIIVILIFTKHSQSDK